MKAVNFASLDPIQRARHITGLGNASNDDELLWREFAANPEAIAAQAEVVYERLTEQTPAPTDSELHAPAGPTELDQVVRTRRVQGFFRAAVLSSYQYRCALSDIAISELLNASHIIPWNVSIERRADPRNGLALNTLYDRAFDRGLIAFDDSLRVILSPRLQSVDPPVLHQQAFFEVEGRQLRLPSRFLPDPAALAYHRKHIFA